MNIIHITTVHKRFDSRIFYKECVSLAKSGFNVSLIVADGLGNQEKEGVRIIDVGLEKNRIKKLFISTKKAYKVAKKLNADIYHFHDPDLLFFGIKLRTKQNRVYFDSHEDFPALMNQRDYIPGYLREILFNIATIVEKYCAKRISGVFSATDNIKDKFLGYGIKQVQTIKNYPIIHHSQEDVKIKNLNNTVCYVGGLTPIRGVREMILASYKAGVRLLLAGVFDSQSYFEELQQMKEWECVEFIGFIPHSEIRERVYSKSSIGLVILHDAPNHRYSIPIKFLEYINAGLPVIASSAIEFCKNIIEKEHCGLVVNPLDVEEIANSIKEILYDKEKAMQMSKNGIYAVENIYNWRVEESKLINVYLNNQ